MTWLTVNQVSELLCKTQRAVRFDVEKNKYEYRHVKGIGRGGKVIEILLESLPEEAQERYHGLTPDPAPQQSPYLNLNEKQREQAAFKHCRVMAYKQFKSTYPKADKMTAFLKQYNDLNPDKTLTKRQLNHWEKLYDTHGINGLVDRRGGHNKGQTAIPDEAWLVFKKLWLQESKPTAQSCYDMTAAYFEDMELPHVSAFLRQIKKEISYPVKVHGREGEKAYQDKCEPFIPTDYSKMYANQQWVADHHIFDVLVEDENGKIFRPWLTAWEDVYSRYVTGYALNSVDPNSDIVLDSFARACIQCGIPESIKTDNGKDYKAFDIFDESFPMSVCNELNIKVTRALPYNAKAKSIERLFGTLEQRYCKHLPSYIGNDPKNRPEKMRQTNAKLKGKVMPYEEFKVFVANMIKTYNTTAHSSLKGKTPQEVYRQGFTVPVRTVKDTDTLNMFLMRTTRPLKVGRNGIYISAIGHYYDSEKLFPYQNQKVYARYNADDVRTVYVFSENREFICIAASVQLSEHGNPVTMEYIRELAKKKKARRKAIREQMPDITAPTASEFTEKKAARYEDIMPDETVIHFNPVIYTQARTIKQEEERIQAEMQEMPDLKVVNGSDRDIDKALFSLFK